MDGRIPASAQKRRRLLQAGVLLDTQDLLGVGSSLSLLGVGVLLVPELGAALSRLLGTVLVDPGAVARGTVSLPWADLLAWSMAALVLLGASGWALAWLAAGRPWVPARIGTGGGLRWPRPRVDRALADLLLALLGLGLLGVLLPLLGPRILLGRSLASGVERGLSWLLWMLGSGVGLSVAVALACHLFERRAFEEQISMTPEEHRRELEEDQGRPELRRALEEARGRLTVTSPAIPGVPRDRVGDLRQPGGTER